MIRSAVIVCAGRSFDPAHLDQVWALGDVLAINYVAYPIQERGLLPRYYLNCDRPDRFCIDWHRHPQVRSIIQAGHENVAKANGFVNYQCFELERKKKRNHRAINPFPRAQLIRPYKSILVAAQYLVRSGYEKVYFYGCDFIADQGEWYKGISTSPLNDVVYRSKVRSGEEQLDYLRLWYPHALSMGCQWISLSPISRLNEFIEYRPLRTGG